jgi:phosphoribosylformylglycinamidine synthase
VLDIAKYRDIWFKTSFLLDQNNLKTEWRRVLTIIKPSIKLYFQHISQEKPVIDASKPRPKAAIIREKEVTQNAKWQMPCILLVLM